LVKLLSASAHGKRFELFDFLEIQFWLLPQTPEPQKIYKLTENKKRKYHLTG